MSAFAALLAAPADLGNVAADGDSSALELPANARLAMSHSASLDAASVTVQVGSRLGFSCPALAADQVHRGCHGERSMSVVVSRAASGASAGTLTLSVIDPFGVPRPVATATFT